jgi:hypothetical protein
MDTLVFVDDQTPRVQTGMTTERLARELVRYLDRVAFVPRDAVLAYASGRIGADIFDRYRAACERVAGPVDDSVWRAVLDTLCTRTSSLAAHQFV